MSSEKRIQATCPWCAAMVEGTQEEFSRPIDCPACGKLAQFRTVLSDKEIIDKSAAVAAKGAKRFSRLTSKLMKKGAAAGREKYKKHRERARAKSDLLSRLRDHLQQEPPSCEAVAELERFAAETGSELRAVARKLEGEAAAFLTRSVDRLLESGAACPDEEQAIRQYLAFLPVSDEVAAQIRRKLGFLRTVHNIRSGKASPVTDVQGLVVRNSEVVWYQADASLIATQGAAGDNRHKGRLFVTNLRLVFTSRTNPLELKLGDIDAVNRQGRHVLLTGKSQRSCAEFSVSDPEILMEHARRAVQVYHRQVDVGFENGGSRHIPQEIKQAVWHRDGGKCRECGATDYLEFDHVIPFSKGGANTTQNLQLLCRRCNGRKSDGL